MDRARVSMSMDDTGMVDEAMNVDYDRLFSLAPWRFVARRLAREAAAASDRPPRKVLDIGCGPGHLVAALARSSGELEVHGLDLSEHMLGIAARRLERAGLADRVTIHRGSAYDLPFADDTFDAVFNTDALHCFDDLPRFFSEAVRVVRPGGVVIVHAWRRDMSRLVGAAMWAQTRYLKATGSHLEGGGVILDASHTASEVARACAPLTGADARVREGVAEFVAVVRKRTAAA